MRNQGSVTVLTARFEDVFARGLIALIAGESNIELVARDVPHDQLPSALESHAPGVAILNLTSLASPADVGKLHGAFPGTRLIVLAHEPSSAACNQMLAFGATACLSKDTQARDVLNAIHLASRGLHVLPTTLARAERHGPELLTRREGDVLELLQQGRTNAQIAASLHVGVETVRTHARNIYRKLGVSTRRDLARLSVPDAPVRPESLTP
jgi:DNA-binding NarL/FixJ family response regulator